MAGYTYILTNKRNGTLYTGVTSNLERRILEHKSGKYGGFTAKYHLDKLVRFQEFQDIQEAISYEKIIKGRVRKKKLALIESQNPNRDDLS